MSSGKQGKPPSVSHVVNPHRASEIRAELLKLAEAEDADAASTAELRSDLASVESRRQAAIEGEPDASTL